MNQLTLDRPVPGARSLLFTVLVALAAGLGGILLLSLTVEPAPPPVIRPVRAVATATPVAPAPAPAVQPRFDRATRNREGFRREFSGFFARARLTPDQMERFLDLVTAEGNLHAERLARIRSGEIRTQEEANAFMRPRVAAFEAQIRALVGDDDYPAYRTATLRIPIERDFKLITAIAARRGVTFDEQQLGLVVDATLESYLDNGASPQLKMTETLLPDAAYRQEVAARQRAFAQSLQQVAPVLTARQVAALQKYQREQIAGWIAFRFGWPAAIPPTGR